MDDISDVKYNDDVTIRGKLVDEDGIVISNHNITLIIDKTEVNVTTTNGIFEHTMTFKELGEKTVTAKYAGNLEYTASEANIKFNVTKQDIVINIDSIQAIKYKDNVTITGKVTDVHGNGLYNINAIIKINGKLYKAKTDKNGSFTFTKSADATGVNNVTVSYAGNTNYNAYATNTTFNVSKQNITITLNKINNTVYKNTVTITGKITDANAFGLYNINVIIKINGNLFKAKTNKNGVFKFSKLANPAGLNNVTVSYAGNAKYYGYSTNTTFNVAKQDINITVNPIKNTTYNQTVTITGKISDTAGNALSNINALIKVNGKLYKARTDSTGTYKFTTPASVLGKNNVTVEYDGNSNYNSLKVATTFNVIAKRE